MPITSIFPILSNKFPTIMKKPIHIGPNGYDFVDRVSTVDRVRAAI